MDLTRNYLMTRVYLAETLEDLEMAKPEHRDLLAAKVLELQKREARLRQVISKKDYMEVLGEELAARLRRAESTPSSAVAKRRIDTLLALSSVAASEEW